jgi:hypothetical protein
MLISCQSSSLVVEEGESKQTIAFFESETVLSSNSRWFNEDAKSRIKEIDLINEEGEELLSKVILGYRNQVPNLEYVESGSADYMVRVNEITVKRGWVTLNFLKPGPIYKMKIKAEILQNGDVVSSISKKYHC